jgi:hypothetical protein
MKYLAQMLIVYYLFGFVSLQAQQAISAAGGNAAGTGGTVSYTVGQAVYTTNANLSGTVTQGCQQPYEILVVTGLKEAIGIDVAFEVYPNPSTDYVKLTVVGYELENLSFRLFNTSGSLMRYKKIMEKETLIEMEGLPPATYFLYIHDNAKEMKTFKIIKN